MIRFSSTVAIVAALLGAPAALAQDIQPASRQALIEQEQAEKAKHLEPYQATTGERLARRAQDMLLLGGLHAHPFFQSAYSGGGFTLGAGYMQHVSPYNLFDVRASYSRKGYKRAEAEFIEPRMFDRRATLSVLGGWREATQVNFFGLGTESSQENLTAYQFEQPYASTLFTIKPTRRFLTLRGGFEWSQWKQGPREGGPNPSIETRYTPDTLPGLGATVKYLHTQAAIGLDSRTSPGYSRRGGLIGIAAHDYTDRDGLFGFRRVDYEVIQHIPILRETWVLSLRGLASTTYDKSGQQLPFFMMPSLGGGHNLRGYSSWRFRDLNSMLMQAEWRVMVNRYLDMAVFYDTGKVSNRISELDLKNLKEDYGIGFRFHGPISTPLRFDVARGREGTVVVFTTSAVF